EVSVIDVCDVAGIPRATFYNYFADKYELVRAAAADLVEKIEGYKPEEGADERTVVSDLIDLIMHYCRTQSGLLAPFFRIGGIVADAVAVALEKKLSETTSMDELGACVSAAQIAYAVKWWTEAECVMEDDFFRERLTRLVGRRS
ncbi:MAG: TetR family transcriptional regulator, partial [Clostridia bacterium]|nr:TetR family transcriptional regulator [Clostridia bacterium]